MANISTIKDRILTYIEKRGIKKTDFYNATGLSESNFKGRNRLSQPGGDMLVKILTTYPELSAEWLLTGEGDIIKNNTDNSTSIKESISVETSIDMGTSSQHMKYSSGDEGIPLIPLNAMAGAFTGDVSIMEYECERYVIPIFKNADFLITVKGDSMYPSFNSGDIVACRKLSLSDLFFQWNKVYVLDTNQGALIKRLKPGSDTEHIRIVSDNPDYDSFELSKESIYNVALVLGVIKQL